MSATITCTSPSSLAAAIEESPIYRYESFPVSNTPVALICRTPDISAMLDGLPSGKIGNVQYIAIIDYNEENFPGAKLKIGDAQKEVPVGDMHRLLAEYLSLERYVYGGDYEAFRLATMGIYFYHRSPYKKKGVLHNPDYYKANKERLEKIYSLLADEESKKIFASRVKAVVSGDFSYTRPSKFRQYFHPAIRPLHGVHVVDAGVSANPGTTISFIEKVGLQGMVWSFEPEPEAYSVAKEKMAQYEGRFNLLQVGLYSHRNAARFCILDGGGSRIMNADDDFGDKAECTVIVSALDDIVREYRIEKLDFIKMDIESAELPALMGAENTLRAFRPDLAICLYHNGDRDAIEIIEFIASLDLGYKLYLGSHRVDMYFDFVLYAIA